MACSEIIAVCSDIQTKHINTLCVQNAEFVNVKPGGTYSNHWARRIKEKIQTQIFWEQDAGERILM